MAPVKSRICLVEPDVMSQKNLVAIFEKAEYEVSAYSKAKEALEGLNENVGDLLVSEWDLEIEGETFCQTVCERYPNLPVIFLSQNHDPENRLAAISCGALDYLIKPFNREVLMAKIASAIKIAGRSTVSESHSHPSPLQEKTGSGFIRHLQASGKDVVIPVPDPESQFGFSYPSVSNWEESLALPDAQVDFLERLASQQLLHKEVYDIIKTCIGCNSINLSVRQICPKCKAPILISHAKIAGACEKCCSPIGGTVSIRCLSCLEEFEEDKANELAIYAYSVNFVSLSLNQSPLGKCLEDNGVKTHDGRLLADFLRLETSQHRAVQKSFGVMKLHFNAIPEDQDYSRELRKLGHIILLFKKTMETNDVLFLLHPDQLVVFSAYQEIEDAKERNKKFIDILARLKLDNMVEITASGYDPKVEERSKANK